MPHLTLLRDLGATHVVYADTSRGRHGGIWDPISKRPALPTDEWPAYGRKLTALAERWPISASAWPSTITWARSSRPTPRSTG